MAKVIAVAGKGGTGKTTLSALLIRSLTKNGQKPILTVDADPNSNLGETLGLKIDKTIGDIRENYMRDPQGVPSGMDKINYLELLLNQVLIEENDYDLLVMGRQEGQGCYCMVNNILRNFTDELVKSYKYLVFDNEAGMEHLSRRTNGKVDTLFLVTDYALRGLRALRRINDMIKELGLDIENVGIVVSRAPEKLGDAFMKEVEDARDLAQIMVAIGNQAGKPTSALITDMNQPLGMMVGNALEVNEAIEVLSGETEGDLKTVSLALAAEMLVSAGLAENQTEADGQLQEALVSGYGLQRLAQMIELLGGDPNVCADTSLLPEAAETVSVRAQSSGYVNQIETAGIGFTALLLGAGRAAKEDRIDPAVGVKIGVRLGDRIDKGDELGRLFVNKRNDLDRAVEHLRSSIVLSEERPAPPALIHERIRGNGE